MNYLSEPLSSQHQKALFNCGKPQLDDYLHLQAGQDMKKKLSACFVLKDGESQLIKGYYTLSNSAISLDHLPASLGKKLPQAYKSIPAVLLGRLAVDQSYRNQGIGKLLLVDALKRCYDISKTLGTYAVIVDPLDKEAERFYSKYGFILLPDSGKMFIAMKTIARLFE